MPDKYPIKIHHSVVSTCNYDPGEECIEGIINPDHFVT